MGKQVLCVWEEENIWEVAKNYEDAVIIVSTIYEAQEADTVGFPQMIFDPKTNKVKNKLYLPYEIVAMRNA